MRKLLLLASLITSQFLCAQSTFTVKYFGTTLHPFGDRTANLQPYKLDKRAVVVLNFGGFVGYEKFLYKDLLSVKIIQGLFADCSAGWASVTHLGLRGLMFENEKNRLYMGFGPTFMVRESWTRFGDAYQSSGFFHVRDSQRLGMIQYKMLPYGLEFEWDRIINEKNSLSLSFTPGVPMAVIFSFGWKHWLTKPTYDYVQPALPRN